MLPMGIPDPLHLLRSLTQVLDQALAAVPWPGLWAAVPPVAVEDTGTEVVVRAQVGQVDPAHLEVRVGPTWVYLAGSRRQEYRHQVPGQWLAASAWGSFATTVPLPAAVDPSRAQAELAGGVLVVRVPRM